MFSALEVGLCFGTKIVVQMCATLFQTVPLNPRRHARTVDKEKSKKKADFLTRTSNYSPCHRTAVF